MSSNNKKILKNFKNIFRGNVKVSVITLNQWAMDFIGNKKRIIKSVNKAKDNGGKIILLPELCTTGYSCQDHFYESETYMLSMNIVRDICNSDLTNDIMLVLGIPVIYDGVKYNTMTFISNGKIILIRPKINLADDGNYREARWFTSWSKEGLEDFELEGFKQKSAPIGVAIINCNGVKIAAEVCEELWIPQSMNIPLYLNDTDIILNSSGSHFEMNKIQKRINLINAATKRSGGAYIYSNMKGCDGERLYFDGGSMIGINGEIVALEERFNLIDVQVLTYPINLDDISEYRLRGSSIQTQSSKVKKIDVINCDLNIISSTLSKPIKNKNIKIDQSEHISDRKKLIDELFQGKHLLINDISDKEIAEICEASSCWLWDYLKRSGAYGFMLPLSGGADSAVVSLLVYLMCKKIYADWDKIKSEDNAIIKRINLYYNNAKNLNAKTICNIILKSVYLPVKGRSFNESKGIESSETYIRSESMATMIGSDWRSTDITEIYKGAKSILETIMKNEIIKTKSNEKRKKSASKGVKSIINSGNNIDSMSSNNIINRERFPNGLQKNGINNPKLWSKYGLADENLQARLRMVVNYLLSLSLNESGFLLTLACSNSDEVLIGYYTKYDASSGDLNPIGSMPKRFVNKALEYYSLLWDSKEYADVLIATPTAELSAMKEGARPQTDEDEIGLSYNQIYYFGKLRSYGYGMIKMFNHIVQNLDKKDVKELIIPESTINNKKLDNYYKILNYIKDKLKVFYHRYRINRHKTVILTPSVHVLPSPDDNRFDLRPFLYPPFDLQGEYIDNIMNNNKKKNEDTQLLINAQKLYKTGKLGNNENNNKKKNEDLQLKINAKKLLNSGKLGNNVKPKKKNNNKNNK
jgi:NAD+ synthase (glutamine-hydrolysing)